MLSMTDKSWERINASFFFFVSFFIRYSSLEAFERFSHCQMASIYKGGWDLVYFAPAASLWKCWSMRFSILLVIPVYKEWSLQRNM